MPARWHGPWLPQGAPSPLGASVSQGVSVRARRHRASLQPASQPLVFQPRRRLCTASQSGGQRCGRRATILGHLLAAFAESESQPEAKDGGTKRSPGGLWRRRQTHSKCAPSQSVRARRFRVDRKSLPLVQIISRHLERNQAGHQDTERERERGENSQYLGRSFGVSGVIFIKIFHSPKWHHLATGLARPQPAHHQIGPPINQCRFICPPPRVWRAIRAAAAWGQLRV